MSNGRGRGPRVVVHDCVRFEWGGPQFFKNLRPPPPRGSIQLCYTGPVVFTRIKRDQQLLDTFFNVVYSINFIKKKKNSIIFRRRFFFRFNNYLT